MEYQAGDWVRVRVEGREYVGTVLRMWGRHAGVTFYVCDIDCREFGFQTRNVGAYDVLELVARA